MLGSYITYILKHSKKINQDVKIYIKKKLGPSFKLGPNLKLGSDYECTF
jgi:hypothetical protein